MQIDRSVIEKELAAVRQQAAQAQQMRAQAESVIVQAAGAEKALAAMLAILDMDEPEEMSERDRAHAKVQAARTKPRGTSARKHINGATQ